jgi:hypothetical protein
MGSPSRLLGGVHLLVVAYGPIVATVGPLCRI